MGRARRVIPKAAAIETDLPPITVDFRDVAEQAGLTTAQTSGDPTTKKYILEAIGNGVVLADFDDDGLLDVFAPSAGRFDEPASVGTRTRLYRNLGGLRFEDITEAAGLSAPGWGQGGCAADYDNDGDRDLFVTNFGDSVLYRNEGGAKFTDVTESAGVRRDRPHWETGCSFVDYDLDGDLDLAVTTYLEFDRQKVPAPGSGGYCQWKGIPVMCGPRGLPFGSHRLLRNLGNGAFEDVSEASGIRQAGGCYGFTVVASDVDNDGDPDLYVACDSTPSQLFLNRGDGTFDENGMLAGVALNDDGQEQGGMGVAVADLDEDGDVDIIKTNFSDDVPNVYHNYGDATFEDRVFRSGLGAYVHYVGWGVNLFDVDHDGRRDLLVVNGHVYPEADTLPTVEYHQPRLFYWNVGAGRFLDISEQSGAGVTAARSARGSAVGDLDNDGVLEVVISNIDARPTLLRNFGKTQNWLLVRLRGGRGVTRDAIGARLFVRVGDRTLSGEVQTGASFLSQNDPRIHVGLAADARYDHIDVVWPGGARERFPGGPANREVVLRIGEGMAAPRTAAPGSR